MSAQPFHKLNAIKIAVLAMLGLLLSFATASATEIKGKPNALHMVSVGIGNAVGQHPLKTTVKDGMDMARWGQSQKGKLFNHVNVTPLINEQASKAHIMAALYQIRMTAQPNDYTILFMSTHGGIHPQSKQYMIFAQDQAIAWSEITQALRDVPGTKIVILDTCQSGAIPQSDKLIVLAGCLSSESTFDGPVPTGNSVFTGHVLDALNGAADMNQNGIVSLAEMVAYVSGKLELCNEGKPAKQQQSCTHTRPENIPDALPLAKLGPAINTVVTVASGPVNGVSVIPAILPGLADTVWTGQVQFNGTWSALSFRFHQGGQVTMVGPQGAYQGTWTQNGNQVTISLPAAQNTFQGTINGGTLSGLAVGMNNVNWAFNVAKTN
jgi:hypothetical protein